MCQWKGLISSQIGAHPWWFRVLSKHSLFKLRRGFIGYVSRLYTRLHFLKFCDYFGGFSDQSRYILFWAFVKNFSTIPTFSALFPVWVFFRAHDLNIVWMKLRNKINSQRIPGCPKNIPSMETEQSPKEDPGTFSAAVRSSAPPAVFKMSVFWVLSARFALLLWVKQELNLLNSFFDSVIYLQIFLL